MQNPRREGLSLECTVVLDTQSLDAEIARDSKWSGATAPRGSAVPFITKQRWTGEMGKALTHGWLAGRLACSLASMAFAVFPLSLSAQHETHRPATSLRLGRVVFPNSGNAAAQEPFLRGLALLHSYEYEDARAAFRDAQRADSGFALAYWTEALAFSQFDWGVEDLPSAQRALTRLAPSRDARLQRTTSARERQFGDAIETFLLGGAPLARALRFAADMRAYADSSPGSVEALSFAARAQLYVLRYAAPADRESVALTAIALATRVIQASPEHPGGVHYLLHASDSPRFASQGLAAARRYDRLAPDADHALHMPSHIFLQLGMWNDVAAANERAWAASRAWVRNGGHGVADLGWHSLQWRQYGYLQQGRWRASRALLDSAHILLDTASAASLRGYPDARYAVETMTFQHAAATGDWISAARALPSLRFSPDSLAAMSLRERQMAVLALYRAAMVHVRAGADSATGTRLTALLNDVQGQLAASTPLHTTVAEMRAQLAALALARGNSKAEALSTLRAVIPRDGIAATAPLGPPGMIPSLELLGELLLASGDAAGAAAALKQALDDRPNRSVVLLALARAQRRLGDSAAARASFRKLSRNWAQADRALPPLAEVRKGAR